MKVITLLLAVFILYQGQLIDCKKSIDIEHQIINDILLVFIGEDPAGHVPPPPPIIPNATRKDSAYHKKYLKTYEKWKKEFNSKRKIVFLNDTLNDYKSTQFDKLYSECKNDFYKNSEYQELLNSLIGIKRDNLPLDIKKIKNSGKYEFEYFSKIDSIRGDYENIARIFISRVVINENKDKACLYIGYHCGRLCGFGTILYVSYTENKWIIVKEDHIWVS